MSYRKTEMRETLFSHTEQRREKDVCNPHKICRNVYACINREEERIKNKALLDTHGEAVRVGNMLLPRYLIGWSSQI